MFYAISVLVQSINQRLQRHVMDHRRKTKNVDNQILEQLSTQKIAENKSEIDKIEDKIVQDIINEDQTDYGAPSPPPFPKSEAEIDFERREDTKEYLKMELAKRERDFKTIRDINAENQVELIRFAIDLLDGQVTNDTITFADYNRTDINEPLPPQVDPGVLKVINEIVRNVNAFVNEPDPSLPAITLSDENNPPKPPPKVKLPTLQDILTEPDETDVASQLKAVKDEIKTKEICLEPPQRTGIKPIDEKNWNKYLETLEVIRPDLFIDEEDEYIEPSEADALVPVGLMDVVPSDDPADLIAQSEVETILLPTDNNLLAILPAEPYSVPTKERTSAPPSPDENIDFSIVPLPIEVDTDKILLTDDGDVELVEPDNMQVEERSLVPLGDGTVALSPVQDMEVVRTKNLILKRKNDSGDMEFANIKMIKNDIDIRVRDVVPYSDIKTILPYGDIKHPIQRKMERDIKNAKKQARLVKSRAIDVTSLDDVDNKPRIKGEWDQSPNVDMATMNRFPWIDFNHILDSTDVSRRDEVILDLLIYPTLIMT